MSAWRVIGMVAVMAAGARAEEPRDILRLSSEAFERGVEQGDTAAFVESAAWLERLVEAHGVRNPKVHANLANAYLLAGDTGRAVLHARRAQRIDPADTKIAATLAAARERVPVDVRATSSRRAWDVAGSWRLWLPSGVVATAFVLGHGATWIGAGLVAARVGRAARVMLAAGIPTAAVSGAFLAAGEWAARSSADAVVLVETEALNGPGRGIYAGAFDRALPAGVEVTLVEHRRGWWRVRLKDAREGWIPERAFERVTGPSPRRE